jgi:hypothetical protein
MKFIKLSSVIINTSKISTVRLLENRYIINISSSNTSGFIVAGSGWIHSIDTVIHVCQKKDPDDYNTVTKWVMDVK